MKQHYLTEQKIRNMGIVLNIISQGKVLELNKLKGLLFDQFMMTPELTEKYLKNLKVMGKIEIDEKNNEVWMKV